MTKNTQAQERLSALMDAEVSEFELRKSLEEIAGDEKASEQWRRYHLAQAAAKGELNQVPGIDQTVDLSGSIMAALDAEPALSVSSTPLSQKAASTKPISGGLFKTLSSMAVAASVTAVVIIGAQNFSSQPSAQVAQIQPQYRLPTTPLSDENLMRAQFGDRSVINNEDDSAEADIIRLSQGLSRYIDQHQTMLSNDAPQWKAGWVPEGYRSLRHETLSNAEVMLFSNGKSAVSVCIEDYGQQTVSEGVAQAAGMIAVGKRRGDKFVTVVGDLPLAMAERIADEVGMQTY